MSDYLGDFAAGRAVRKFFNTKANADGSPATLGGTPAVAVYADGSPAESTAGVTLTVDFDGRAGLNLVAVDTTGFATGADYEVVLTAGTVAGVSVAGTSLAKFSLQNRYASAAGSSGIGALANDGTATLNLKAFNVINDAGDAMTVQSTGGGGRGLLVAGVSGGMQVGADSGPGLSVYGGGSGSGIQVAGGASDGSIGLAITSAATNGQGLYLAGSGTGEAIRVEGGSTGAALSIAGPYTSGDAVTIATTSGHAILAVGGGADGDGFRGVGAGTGVGFLSTPDASGFGAGGGGGSGTVDANLVSVDGLTTADGMAVLNLKRLVIANDTADAAFSVTNSIGSGLKVATTGIDPAVDLESVAATALRVVSQDQGGVVVSTNAAGAYPAVAIYAGGGAALELDGGPASPALLIYGPYGTPGPAVLVDNTTGSGYAGGGGIAVAADGGHDVALIGSGDVLGNLAGLIDGLTPAGLATLFGVDSGTTFADAVPGSPVREIAANAAPADYQQRGVPVTLPTLPPVTLAAGSIATATFAPGATLPRVTVADTATALTNLPAITADWLTAAGLAPDAVAEIAGAILADPAHPIATDASGFVTTSNPAVGGSSVTEATIWAYPDRALTDRGDFTLTADYDPARSAAQAGDAMTLDAAYDPAKSAASGPDLASLAATVGVAGAGLTDLGDARLAHLDADVSSRLATAGTTPPPAAGIVVAGSTGGSVTVAGLPAGKSYIGQRLYHAASGEARTIAGQTFASANYTFNFTGTSGTEAGPFSSVSAGDVVIPVP